MIIRGQFKSFERLVGHIFSAPKNLMIRKKVPSTQTVSKSSISDSCHNDDIFHYARARFVINEEYEMSQRYVNFNVDELARLAAKVVGSKSCVSIEKYPDGMYNKAMLLTTDDGNQAVAKVPNPNAGNPHFTTASEIATMEFVRKNLKTPLPKVYAWSSKTQDNPVGAEYIILEKHPGVQLELLWPKMEIEDRLNIVKTIAGYHETWVSCSFQKFGSLYYAEDLDSQAQSLLYTDPNGVTLEDPRFSIGPSTGRGFNDDGRATVEFDRGPWNTLEAYLSAIGHREIACVRDLPQLPSSPITLRGPGTYQATREKKLKALRCYLAMVPYLLPTDYSIQSSCIWHSDLHLENIFVDPDNPSDITGIIDWQSTELAPLFYHAGLLCFLDYDGPETVGLERPDLPENFAQLDRAAKKKANALFVDMSLCVYYKTFFHLRKPEVHRAIEFQGTETCHLLSLSRKLLVDGEATYLALVAELDKTWANLPGVQARGAVPFPFHFSAEEKEEIEADSNGALRGMNLMSSIKDCIGHLFPEKGVIRKEDYDEARDALRQMKEHVMETYASNENERKTWNDSWPFDD